MQPPKLIDKWFDRPNNIHNYVYRYENGVRLVFSQNPATVEFNLSVALQAGSFFERSVGVPQGTAHFLEHMLNKPNDLLKTQVEMDSYLFGNRTQPTIYRNAATSRKFLYFFTHANEAAYERMITYLNHIIHYPLERFAEFIETERKIILAEWQSMPKLDKHSGIQAELFLLDGNFPEFSEAVIGTDKSIAQVSIDDLQKYYRSQFNADNLILAIQTKQKPNRTLLTRLGALASGFEPAAHEFEIAEEPMPNRFRYRVFNDPRQQGLFMSFNYFVPRRKDYDYKEQVLYYLLNSLIDKIGNDEYREKLGLVYGVGSVRMFLTWEWLIRGFRLTCNPEHTKELLDLSLTFWDKGIEFLETEQGKSWFVSELSRFIFPQNTQFDHNYAEDIAVGVLEKKYKYIYAKAAKVARSLKVKELINFVDKNFRNTPPHLWIETSLPETEVEEVIKSSKLVEYWKDKPTVLLT